MTFSQFNVLDPMTEVRRSRFLQASAGTGKTFAIEHLFVRFLLEEKELTLEQILVVTFTRAAVRDLKNRIRRNVERALKCLRAETKTELDASQFPYLEPYLIDEELRLYAIRKLQSTLALFDQSQIFTIHGFCHRMLSEFSFAAQQLIQLEAPMQSKVFGENVAIDFLRYDLSLEQYHPHQIAEILKKKKGSSPIFSKVIQQAKTIAAVEENVGVKEDFFQFRKALLSFLPSISKQKFLHFFEEIFPLYKITKFDAKSLLAQVGILGDALDKNEFLPLHFEKLLSHRFSLFSFLAETNKKKKAASENDAMHHFFQQLRGHVLPVVEKVCDVRKQSQSLFGDLAKKLEEKREEEEILTHDSILKKMEEALSLSSFTDLVQKRYRVAIIDEFQDTDPLQWRIFERIFLDKNLSFLAVYLVGDPKQSIYSFRNADLYSYLNAEEIMGKPAKAFLDTNFRSTPQLVDSLNYFFSEQFAKKWLTLPKLNGTLSYNPVRAGLPEKKLFDESKAALHFALIEGKSTSRGWPSKAMEQELFFPYIIEEIRFLMKEHHFAFSDFAVLVSTRYQAETLKRAFEKAHMPYVMRTSKSLLETEAFGAMRDLLYATLHPHDISGIKVAMAGPLLQMTAEEILFEKRTNRVQQKFVYLHSILKEKGLPAFFSNFWQADFRDDGIKCLERVAENEDLSLYFHLTSLMDLMGDYLDSDSLFLLEDLEKLADVDAEEESRLNASLFFDDKGIQILTTHISKGLEFEVVFALGMGARPPAREEENDTAELDAEKLRQLYVALTRAKQRVYVPFALDESPQAISNGAASPLEVFFSQIVDEKPSKENVLPLLEKLAALKKASYEWISLREDVSTKERSEMEVIIPIMEIPFITHPVRNVSSFTSLTSQEKILLKDFYQNENYTFSPQNLPSGPSTGVTLHTIFERVFREYSSYPGKEAVGELVKEETEMGALSGYHEVIAEMVDSAFHVSLLPEDTFALKDLSFAEAEVEMEFIYSDNDQPFSDIYKGSIDLVFRWKDKYFLLDWKSNWLGDDASCYQSSALKEAMSEHQYYLQANIYKKAFGRYFQAQMGREIKHSFGGILYLFLRGLSPNHDLSRGVLFIGPDDLEGGR